MEANKQTRKQTNKEQNKQARKKTNKQEKQTKKEKKGLPAGSFSILALAGAPLPAPLASPAPTRGAAPPKIQS